MKYTDIKRYINIIFCFGFLPVISILVPVGKWLTVYPDFALILFIFLYALYFSIQAMNLPRKFSERKYWQIGLFMLVILGLTWLISRYPYPPEVLANSREPGLHYMRRAQTVWFMSLLVTGFSLAVSLLFELYRQNIIQKDLAEKKKDAELALYKAQINPHFLFNTLNTLYGLVVCKSDKAEDAFIRFSSLIKYTYSRVKTDKVALSEEAAYIKDYIGLQRLRLNSHTKVDFKTDLGDDIPQIPPMILISFVENAFKYGVSSHEDSSIDVSISSDGKSLDFHCSNDIRIHPAEKNVENVGLENTKARLERIYGRNFTLETGEHDGKYTVNLKIKFV